VWIREDVFKSSLTACFFPQQQNFRWSGGQIRVEFGTSSLVYVTAQAFKVLEVLFAVVANRFAITAVSAFMPHRADQSVNFLKVGM